MAVDKLSGTPNFVQILSSRVSLEDALTRFDEQCSRYEPSVIRKRLRKHLSNVRIHIDSIRGNEEV